MYLSAKLYYMKNFILIIGLCFISFSADAQMTLAHHFSGDAFTEGAMVNLSRSGKKIVRMNWQNSILGLPDTLFFYNLDYSFWKMIPCPHIARSYGQFNFQINVSSTIGVHYPSETLFNTDTFLEVAVFYQDSGSFSGGPGRIMIINELGNIVDSILHVPVILGSSFHVYRDTTGVCKAVVSTMTGVEVYNLPGTLPCDPCGGGLLELSSIEKPTNNILTQPIPNPSKDEVKITFTLPEGTSRGELQLYGTNGQKIKTFQVDNRFGYIMLDNSQLASGVYYYNIVVNGQVSTTQKFVVIK